MPWRQGFLSPGADVCSVKWNPHNALGVEFFRELQTGTKYWLPSRGSGFNATADKLRSSLLADDAIAFSWYWATEPGNKGNRNSPCQNIPVPLVLPRFGHFRWVDNVNAHFVASVNLQSSEVINCLASISILVSERVQGGHTLSFWKSVSFFSFVSCS